MTKRQKIIISITGIVLVMLILVGLTYAYFLTRINGNTNDKSISVTTANLILKYDDINDVLISETAVEPGKSWIKTFSATNEGNKTVTYGVALENLTNTLERNEDLVYTLSCTQYTKSTYTVSNGVASGTTSGTCNGVSETTFPILSSILVQNSIEIDKVQAYTLTVTYKEQNIDQSIDMNKQFSAKVNLVDPSTFGTFGTNTLATAIYNNAINATGEQTVYQGSPTTKPAEEISLETERTLSKTMDDYGVSLYYRGNVIDNYVNFAGMCWRIVRIEGDGSTKLILEDRSAECNSSNYTGNWSDGTSVRFGNDSNNNKADFLNSSGGLADSLKSFQTTLSSKLTTRKTLSDYLKVDDWCYDDTTASTSGYGYDDDYNTIYEQDQATNGWYIDEYYGAHKRIITDKSPSLKCTGTKLNKYRDNTDMYVGTLTADEMSFAGATMSTNYTHYLMNSYVKNNCLYWWGLSPSANIGEYYDYSAFLLNRYGSLDSYDVGSNGASYCGYYSRPAITLLSNTKISSGNGTIENPYIITN